MAWREYSELKPEDQRKEDERQKMIVCQSCLERAVDLTTHFKGVITLEDIIISKTVTDIASLLVDWVYEKASGKSNSPAADSELPLPTQEQNVILARFEKEYHYTKEQVYTAYGRYPCNVGEAKECLAILQKGK